jgi:hypothetical protein
MTTRNFLPPPPLLFLVAQCMWCPASYLSSCAWPGVSLSSWDNSLIETSQQSLEFFTVFVLDLVLFYCFWIRIDSAWALSCLLLFNDHLPVSLPCYKICICPPIPVSRSCFNNELCLLFVFISAFTSSIPVRVHLLSFPTVSFSAVSKNIHSFSQRFRNSQLNPQIYELVFIFANFCGNLRFCDLQTTYIFAICGFADLIIFCGLKTSANPQTHNFSLRRYKIKILSFKFKDDFWLLGVTCIS